MKIDFKRFYNLKLHYYRKFNILDKNLKNIIVIDNTWFKAENH